MPVTNARQFVFTEDTMKRESGRKVQLENVKAAKAIADVIRTSLGPRAMLKVNCFCLYIFWLVAYRRLFDGRC